MSRTIELPEDVYARIEEAATSSGHSVAEVIASRFPSPSLSQPESDDTGETMADVLAGHIGTFASGGLDAIAARPGDAFSDYLVEKKRSGHL